MTQPLASWALTYRYPLWVSLQRFLRRTVISATERRTGLSFLCTPGAERMMPEVFHYRVYDVPTAPVRKGDLVIDVGASHGFVACRYAARGARVLAIEPDPDSFLKLQVNVEANGLTHLVQALRCAVGAIEEERPLYRSHEYGGGMSTTISPRGREQPFHTRDVLPVRIRPLASLWADWGADRIRLLKLDCEGGELEILQSLPAPLWNRVDSIAIEAHAFAYPLEALVAQALERGFHVSRVQSFYPNLHFVHRNAVLDWARSEDAT